MALSNVAEELGGEVLKCKKLNGLSNECYRLDVSSGSCTSSFAVKIYLGKDAKRKAEKELELFKIMPRYGLKAPEVCLTDIDGRFTGKPLLVWKWINSVPAGKVLEKKAFESLISRTLAAVLANFHKIPWSGLNPNIFPRKVRLWEEELYTLRLLAKLAGFKDNELIPFATVLEELEIEQPVLVHGDFNPGNVLVGEDGVYIMDLENAFVGDPLYDVAYAFAFISFGERWNAALSFVQEYFKLSGCSLQLFTPKLMATAAKLHFFLSLEEIKSLIKVKGISLPLAEVVFLRPFKKHLRNIFHGGISCAAALHC
ncbi:MAG: aminoglycoside phosphotransferase family protein [Thermofilaceae archaeon]